MKIENMINIKKYNIEEKIEAAIENTRTELEGLTTETTCFIYSAALSRNLFKEHLANEILSTKEFNYPYEHQFNIVMKNEETFYLLDLTYSQFKSNKFYELLQNGYMLVTREQVVEYLDEVGNANQSKRKI